MRGLVQTVVLLLSFCTVFCGANAKLAQLGSPSSGPRVSFALSEQRRNVLGAYATLERDQVPKSSVKCSSLRASDMGLVNHLSDTRRKQQISWASAPGGTHYKTVV